MTKIKYLVLCLATIVLAVVFCISCNDEQENKKESTVTKKIAPRSDLRVFHWPDRQADPYCSGTGGNCLDDVVIVAERPRVLLTNFYNSVINDEYLRFINENRVELNQYFEPEVLTMVLNAELRIQCTWRTKLFFIFVDANNSGNVVRAYPFNINR
jgi:hypothetical protein